MALPKYISDYKIIEELGSGSYGVVYKVIKQNETTEYVLKQIPLIGLQENERKYIENEAKFLSELNSKYIVKYRDSFNEGKKLNIIMEYCNKGDLDKYLTYMKKKKIKHLPEEIVWKLFIQISLGIAYLHSKRILHRDLKTLNIFLKNNLQVKIGDLGVAKQLEKGKFATTFIGTPYYLSPEICEDREYNEKSDIWALGCILFELCTFNHPFDARSQAALILKIINEPVGNIPNDFSSDLKNLIKVLLEKNDVERPTMKDILSRNDFQTNAKKYGFYNDVYEFIQKNVNIKKIVIKKDNIGNNNNNKCSINDNERIKFRPNSAINRKNEGNVIDNIKYSFNNNINNSNSKEKKKGNYGVVRIPKNQSNGHKKIKITPSAKNINSNIKINKEKQDNPPIIVSNINKMIEEFERQQKLNIEKQEKDNIKEDKNKEDKNKEDKNKEDKIKEDKIKENKELKDKKEYKEEKKEENYHHLPKRKFKSEDKKGENKIENKLENKIENKKDDIMEYKSTDFFNNLNKAKPIILKDIDIPEESISNFIQINNNNKNKNDEDKNLENKKDEFTESKMGISNLDNLLNDYGKTRDLVRTRDKIVKKENKENKENEVFDIIVNDDINRKNIKHNTEKINKTIKSKTIDSDSDFEYNTYNNQSDDDSSEKEEDETVKIINKKNINKDEKKNDKGKNEKNNILKCINELKCKLKETIGEDDYNIFIQSYNKLNENKDGNEVYKEIEDFFKKNYSQEKIEEVHQIYLRLIINAAQLNKFNEI